MKIKVLRKLRKPTRIYKAASLDDAYQKGLFHNSMTRYELMDRITKYNPSLRWHANKTHRGLFDTELDRYICGITHNMTIPKYTISKYDSKFDRELPKLQLEGSIKTEYIHTDDSEGYILARGWLATLQIVQSKGYEVNWEGIS